MLHISISNHILLQQSSNNLKLINIINNAEKEIFTADEACTISNIMIVKTKAFYNKSYIVIALKSNTKTMVNLYDFDIKNFALTFNQELISQEFGQRHCSNALYCVSSYNPKHTNKFYLVIKAKQIWQTSNIDQYFIFLIKNNESCLIQSLEIKNSIYLPQTFQWQHNSETNTFNPSFIFLQNKLDNNKYDFALLNASFEKVELKIHSSAVKTTTLNLHIPEKNIISAFLLNNPIHNQNPFCIVFTANHRRIYNIENNHFKYIGKINILPGENFCTILPNTDNTKCLLIVQNQNNQLCIYNIEELESLPLILNLDSGKINSMSFLNNQRVAISVNNTDNSKIKIFNLQSLSLIESFNHPAITKAHLLNSAIYKHCYNNFSNSLKMYNTIDKNSTLFNTFSLNTKSKITMFASTDTFFSPEEKEEIIYKNFAQKII